MSVSVHHDISLVMRMRHDKGAPQGPEGGRERRRRPGPSTAPQSTQDPRPHIYKNCLHPRRRMKAPNWALTAKRHEPQRIRGKGQPNLPEADHVSVTRDWPKCPRTPSPPHDKEAQVTLDHNPQGSRLITMVSFLTSRVGLMKIDENVKKTWKCR